MSEGNNKSYEFACCSRYLECSNAKRCLIPEAEYSASCTYRRNLGNNRIFYGKNASGFSNELYDDILRAIDSFSDDTRNTLDLVLMELCDHKRGSTSIIIRNNNIEELSLLGVFDIHTLGSLFPFLCSKAILKQRIKADPEYAIVWKKAEQENRIAKKTNGERQKNAVAFVDEWLNTQGTSLRDRLADPYRVLRVITDKHCYVECLYRERLLNASIGHINTMSPLAEDGWVSKSTLFDDVDTSKKGTMPSDSVCGEEPCPELVVSFNDHKSGDVKRAIAAKEIKEERIASIDRIAKCATFYGSDGSSYQVSLSSCSCMDYTMRLQPCKHMFRLAMELGVLKDTLPKFDKKRAKAYDISAEVETLYQHWKNGEITSEAYVACLTALEKSSGKAK